MPNRLAVSRWPASCRQTDTRMPSAKISTPIQKLMPGPSCSLLVSTAARSPGPALGVEDVRDAPDVPHLVLVEHLREGVDDTCEPQPAGDERRHADLVGGVVDGRGGAARLPRRRAPAGRPGRRRRRGAGTPTSTPWSSRSRRPRRAPGPASRGRGRSGSRMSGGLACASVEPSTNSTIECTTDCGWTTTSTRSSGTSKSRCASSSSRPLFTRVAELIVTTGPMSQVGWASACSTVTSCSSSRLRPRNGPPLAVSTSRRTSARRAAAQALGERRVLGVDRDDLVRPLDRGPDQRTAGDERLLVRQREGAARPRAPRASGRGRSSR